MQYIGLGVIFVKRAKRAKHVKQLSAKYARQHRTKTYGYCKKIASAENDNYTTSPFE